MQEPEEESGCAPSPAGLVGCVVLLGLILVIAIPNLIEARKHRGETAPIGALKTIGTSQSLFREGDKDGDDTLDYGTLSELHAAGLIDDVLGSGTKMGYTFRVWHAPKTPEFLWMATANPIEPGKTGDRYFVVNQEGVIHYTTAAPFGYRADCTIPEGARPVGR
jgi:hypothetical protein